MQGSAKNNKPNSKELPEVYVLKKEVQFDIWRHTFADVCHALGVRKILNTTPAVRNKAAKREASYDEFAQKLGEMVKNEPKQPQLIKQELPSLNGMKPEEAVAALAEYREKLEKHQNAFEREWVKYLTEKREHELTCKRLQKELDGMATMKYDEEVTIISSKTKKTGSDTNVFIPKFSKTQVLDADESKLFGVDHEWMNAETNDFETADETMSRMKLWKWLEKSLEGGPCKHLINACEIPGDVRTIYYQVKDKCTRVTELTFGLALADFFHKGKFLDERDPQVIFTRLKQEAATLEEMAKRLSIPPTVHSAIVKTQLMVALMINDPDKMNQRAMLDLVSGEKMFTSEELVEHLRKQHILARELGGVTASGSKLHKNHDGKASKVEANEMTTSGEKKVGYCYHYQKEAGCQRKDCKFRHEKMPDRGGSSQERPYRPSSARCMRCGKEGHAGEDCPDTKKLLCSFCHKKGHCVEVCQANPANKKPSHEASGKGGRGKGGRGRGTSAHRGGRKAANALETVEEQDDEDSDVTSDDSDYGGTIEKGAYSYRGTMVLQSREVNINAVTANLKEDGVRVMIDSGCDILAMKDRGEGYDLQSARVVVNEATKGSSIIVECRGKVNLELPMGGKFTVDDAIFSKEFRHNLIGTSTLGAADLSTLFHNGKVHLIDSGSVGEFPTQWKMRACEGVDEATGLPFITMKTSKPSTSITSMVQSSAPGARDVARAKEINANRKTVATNLARKYTCKREGSTKADHEWELAHRAMGHPSKKTQAKTMGVPVPDGNRFFCEHCALGSGNFHGHVRKPRSHKRVVFTRKFGGQAQPRKTLNDWIKHGVLKRQGKREITLEDWESLLAMPSGSGDSDLERVKPGQNTAADISGPHTRSLGGAYYTINMVCRKTTYRLARTMKRKSDAPEMVRAMLTEMQARSGNKMRRFRADGDGSFTSGEMKELLGDYQVFLEYSSPYDHPQNGAAEASIGLMEKDVKVSLSCSEAPPMMWGEAVGHHQVTRNHIKSQRNDTGKPASPALLLEGRQMRPEEFIPFGVLTVVAIAKKQRKEGKTITQKVAWTGACVGYGELTGHGGALRIYDPEKGSVKVVSRNLCTFNLDVFYWKEKRKMGWKDTESPASWMLTPEALMDPEEVRRYEFDDDVLMDISLNLADDTMLTAETNDQDQDDVEEQKRLPPAVLMVDGVPQGGTRSDQDVPALEDDPSLPTLVVGGEEVEPARRSQRQRIKKPKQDKVKPMKTNQGYIDGILGEENVEGKEHILVHWEGFAPGNDTSSMSKAYAKKFPVLRKMLEDYEHAKHTDIRAEEKAPEKVVEPPRPIAEQGEETRDAKVNMATFLGNSHGNGMKQMQVPYHIACWIAPI